MALDGGGPFTIAAHDPVIVAWALQSVPKAKGLLEFGF